MRIPHGDVPFASLFVSICQILLTLLIRVFFNSIQQIKPIETIHLILLEMVGKKDWYHPILNHNIVLCHITDYQTFCFITE